MKSRTTGTRGSSGGSVRGCLCTRRRSSGRFFSGTATTYVLPPPPLPPLLVLRCHSPLPSPAPGSALRRSHWYTRSVPGPLLLRRRRSRRLPPQPGPSLSLLGTNSRTAFLPSSRLPPLTCLLLLPCFNLITSRSCSFLFPALFRRLRRALYFSRSSLCTAIWGVSMSIHVLLRCRCPSGLGSLQAKYWGRRAAVLPSGCSGLAALGCWTTWYGSCSVMWRFRRWTYSISSRRPPEHREGTITSLETTSAKLAPFRPFRSRFRNLSASWTAPTLPLMVSSSIHFGCLC